MAYVALSDIEDTVGVAATLTCFDDDNDGVADAGFVEAVITRACAWVDSYMSRAYPGTYPLATTPAEVKEAALFHAIARMYDRKPEYVRTTGDGARVNYREMGDALLRNLVAGVQAITETSPAQGYGPAGGIVATTGPRLMIDSPDGTSNGGDF